MTKTPRKRTTKKDQLIKLLGSKSGCDIRSLSTKLGWQQHTTRAVLCGLRKSGYALASERPASGGTAKYRILSAPASPQSATPAVQTHGA
jgi:predicted transcriptional regulator